MKNKNDPGWDRLPPVLRHPTVLYVTLAAFGLQSVQRKISLRAQWLISVSRPPPRALIFQARTKKKKKTILSFRFCQIFGTRRPLPAIPANPLSLTYTHFPLSVLLSSLHAIPHIVWISNTDTCSNRQKMITSYENEKLDCMCGYGYSRLLWGLCFLFSHARIGLLIEPEWETEKLIIVP